jgi:coatomer protein complex subunit gamma
MSDISNEFKLIVVDAIRSLALKFPSTFHSTVRFLSNALRDEGGADFKDAIVSAIIDIVKSVNESREEGLLCLCEYIEDCEWVLVSVKVLDFVGEQAHLTPYPIKYIRYIYNRIVLEVAAVRAAAVTALAHIASKVGDSLLMESILSILTECLSDPDDEVRDRSIYFIQALKNHQSLDSIDVPWDPEAFSLAIDDYIALGDFSVPFDFSLIPVKLDAPSPVFVEPITPVIETAKPLVHATLDLSSFDASSVGGPKLEQLGKLWKSSRGFPLTESGTEYTVQCFKHLFQEFIVFQVLFYFTLV